MSPMTSDELLFWWIDQEINWRGLGTDTGRRDRVHRDSASGARPLRRRVQADHRARRDAAPSASGVAGGPRAPPRRHGRPEAIDGALEPRSTPLPPDVRRVLEIRQLIGSASVKKLFAMQLQASSDGRLRNLIVHHGARTGRPTGEGAQPLNMPRGGPAVRWCGLQTENQRDFWTDSGCRRPAPARPRRLPVVLRIEHRADTQMERDRR